jgi:hypothetical protein
MSTLKANDIQTTGGLANRGRIIQVVTSSTTSQLTGNLGGSNGAAPTSTTGTQFHSFNFTPLRSDSTIHLISSNVCVGETSNSNDVLWVAAFAGTSLITAQSSPTSYYHFGGSYNATWVNLCGSISSWGTSLRTISIRVGAGNASGNNIGVNIDDNYNSQTVGVREVNFRMMEVAP